MAHRHGHPLAMAPPPSSTAGSGHPPVQPTSSRFLVGSPSAGAVSPGHAGHAASYAQTGPSSRAARANATGLHHTGAGLTPPTITQPGGPSSAGFYSHAHPRAGVSASPPGAPGIGYPYATSVGVPEPVFATCTTSLSDAAQAQLNAALSFAGDKFKGGWANATTFPHTQTQTQTQVLIPAAPGRVQVPGPAQVQVPVQARIPAPVQVPTPAYSVTFFTSQPQASTSAQTLDIDSNFHSANAGIRGNLTMAIAPASYRAASTASGVRHRAVRTATAQSRPPISIPASGSAMSVPILPGPFPEVPVTSSLVPAVLPPPGRRESIDSTSSTEHVSPTSVYALSPAEDEERSREKPRTERKHGCWMCHKAFDRPSTLVKHLLVHTGEKAYQCETCGRRFGVQSNLNRHAKRCKGRAKAGEGAQAVHSGEGEGDGAMGEAAEPAAASVSATGLPTTSLTGDDASNTDSAMQPATGALSTPASVSSPPLPPPATAATRGRKRPAADATSPETPDASAPPAARPPSASASPSTTSASATAATTAPRAKRRRRAPSPHRWVPDSLRLFDLTPYAKSTPVPLPPVQPGTWEERNSFEEDVSATPYHPTGWRGRLPGPGLMERPVDGMGCGILVL